MLPNGKIVFYNSMMYSGNTSGQASSITGFTFKITFDNTLQGKTWTLTGGTTTLTGVVPSNNYIEITVSELNITFSLTCNDITMQVKSAQYYGYTTVIFNNCHTDFNSNTWEQISNASQKGIAANVWSVGATKTIHIEGTIGTLPVNQDIQVYIIGINHNSEKEGTNRIHIQIGKNIQGLSVAFCDDRYGKNGGSTGLSMNSNGTNVGGWKESQMRNTILHSGTVPSDTGSNTFMSILPSDLRAVMKSCTKYTDNTGGRDNASYVTATTEYLPLLSEFEVLGSRHYANVYEQNYQNMYAYYIAGNPRSFRGAGMKTSNDYVSWWLRSPSYYNREQFALIKDGDYGSAYAYNSLGVSPIFFV